MSAHLFECLSQEEWKLCYILACLNWFEGYEDAYPIDDYPSPGSEGETENAEEMFRRAIRFLTLEHGMEFEGLSKVDASGSIRGVPIERRNLLYLDALRQGLIPSDFVQSAGAAVRVANERCPSLNTRPIEEFLFEQRDLVRKVRQESVPEETERAVRDAEKVLRAIGIERIVH